MKNPDDLKIAVENTTSDGVLPVDYLQLLPVKSEETVHTLKLIAKEKGIPVIAAFQLHRDTQIRPSEINAFANEPEIDSVLVLQRDESGSRQVVAEKNAHGARGTVPVLFGTRRFILYKPSKR